MTVFRQRQLPIFAFFLTILWPLFLLAAEKKKKKNGDKDGFFQKGWGVKIDDSCFGGSERELKK